jgi:hypothetical protein
MNRFQLDENHEKVLGILVKSKSMPLLELTSISDLDDELIHKIVSELEQKDLVKIVNRGNPLEEIVTVKEKAFAS